MTVQSMRTKLRQNVSVLTDLEANREAYDLTQAVGRLGRPLLLIHGREDLVTKPAEALELYGAADQSRTELVLVDRAGRTFGMRAPFNQTNDRVEFVLETTARWFHRDVGGGQLWD